MHDNPSRSRRTAALLLMAIAFCACSDSAASPAATDDETAASGEVAQANSAAEDCPYLSAAEAEAVLGYRVELTSASTFGHGKCEFAPVGGERHGAGELVVMVMGPMEDSAADFADTRAMAGEVEEVADLGEAAFLYASELWVLSSPYQVMVRVDWYGEKYSDVRKADIDIAEKVLARLQAGLGD